nr:hypothetical protein [Tanacetum cinerariifolium]
MGDEHLDTISATESDEVIKSSVENLVLIPSEFKGIPDTMCDVHLVNNPTPLEAKDHFEIVINSNNDYSSSDNDSLYYENIEYVEASPHDSELVSLEVEKIVIPEDEEIEDDNLREKLLKVNLLVAEIEALKDNPIPSSEFLTKSSSTSPTPFLEGTNTFHNSLSEFENFCFDLEEISSGSTTTHSVISLSELGGLFGVGVSGGGSWEWLRSSRKRESGVIGGGGKNGAGEQELHEIVHNHSRVLFELLDSLFMVEDKVHHNNVRISLRSFANLPGGKN